MNLVLGRKVPTGKAVNGSRMYSLGGRADVLATRLEQWVLATSRPKAQRLRLVVADRGMMAAPTIAALETVGLD